MIDALRERFTIPVQNCVLAHVTTQMEAMQRGRARGPGVSVDRRNRSGEHIFGVNLALLGEATQAGAELRRGALLADGRGGRERDVLRDRAGIRALGERASWRGSADAARRALTRWRVISSPCW